MGFFSSNEQNYWRIDYAIFLMASAFNARLDGRLFSEVF